jgi:hypothetical protein
MSIPTYPYYIGHEAKASTRSLHSVMWRTKAPFESYSDSANATAQITIATVP